MSASKSPYAIVERAVIEARLVGGEWKRLGVVKRRKDEKWKDDFGLPAAIARRHHAKTMIETRVVFLREDEADKDLDKDREIADELHNAAWLMGDNERICTEALEHSPDGRDWEQLVRYIRDGARAYRTTRWALFKKRMGWK